MLRQWKLVLNQIHAAGAHDNPNQRTHPGLMQQFAMRTLEIAVNLDRDRRDRRSHHFSDFGGSLGRHEPETIKSVAENVAHMRLIFIKSIYRIRSVRNFDW